MNENLSPKYIDLMSSILTNCYHAKVEKTNLELGLPSTGIPFPYDADMCDGDELGSVTGYGDEEDPDGQEDDVYLSLSEIEECLDKRVDDPTLIIEDIEELMTELVDLGLWTKFSLGYKPVDVSTLEY